MKIHAQTCFEFEQRDFWVGFFWNVQESETIEHEGWMELYARICLIPCCVLVVGVWTQED